MFFMVFMLVVVIVVASVVKGTVVEVSDKPVMLLVYAAGDSVISCSAAMHLIFLYTMMAQCASFAASVHV